MILLISCATIPLKLTVFGREPVTSNEAVPFMVNVFAIPKLELEESNNFVPEITTSYRSAFPLRDVFPVKEAVCSVAEKLPSTINPPSMVNLEEEITEPVIFRFLKKNFPAPEIVLLAPLILIVLPGIELSELKVVSAFKFPVINRDG